MRRYLPGADVAMRQVAGDALHDRGHIVQVELRDEGGHPHEHGQRLANAASGAWRQHLGEKLGTCHEKGPPPSCQPFRVTAWHRKMKAKSEARINMGSPGA